MAASPIREGFLVIEQAVIAMLKNATARHLLLGVGFFTLVTLLLATGLHPGEVDLKPGQICPRDITAPRTAVLVDEAKTEELRQQAAAEVQKVYQEDAGALQAMQQQADEFYHQVREISHNAALDASSKEALLRRLVEEKLAPPPGLLKEFNSRTFSALLKADEDSLEQIAAETRRIAAVVMSRPLKEEDLAAAREQARLEAQRLPLNEDYRKWVTLVLQSTVRPTMILNQEATDRLVAEARSRVQPVQRTVMQGQVIIRKGDPVKAEDIEILKQLGLQRTRSWWITAGGLVLLVLVLGGISFFYLRLYHPAIYANERLTVLFGLLILVCLAANRGVAALNFSSSTELASTSGYLIPAAACSMLTAILLDTRLGIFSTILMGITVGIITQGQDISFVMVALISGLVGVYSVSRVNQGWDLAKAGLLIGGVNLLVIVAVGLISYDANLSWVLWGSLCGVLNGLLSAVFATGILPYLETAFGVTSAVRLLELANPNQPLLKRLLLEAPGTYHHSIVVGNLAEAAAEAVGAQPLVVRVGAYYHDIGKLKRPYFFIENQRSKENPHDKISPNLSSLVITSHIKDGVELARQYRLPQVVVDIINQHHGNSLVAYFYQRALENDQFDTVEEASYRYDAPKPQTREAALIMLADAVEAAVRSLQKPTPGRIEGLVRRIIKDKLNDGQLEECDLTFKDLDLIATAFVRVLSGIYHARIEYPELPAREVREVKKQAVP